MKRKGSKPRHFAVEALEYEWKMSKDSKGSGKTSGIDNIWPTEFAKNLDDNLRRISNEISSKNFGFKKLKVVAIPKDNGKQRIICIPTVGDRLVQRRIVRLLTTDKSEDKKYLSKKLGLENNPIIYGLGDNVRKNSGVQDAVKRVIKVRKDFPWVLKTDIQSFFDSIDRKFLNDEFKKRFKGIAFADLVEKAINCEADDRKKSLLEENGIKKGVGIRQGMPLSPILSNFFLRSFDKNVSKKIGSKNIIRYADDIIVLGKSKKECEDFHLFIEDELEKINLEIPSLSGAKSKTKIVAPNDSVTFLGIEIYKGRDGEYGQNIDPKKCEEIKVNFRTEFIFENAIKNKMTLSTLLQRFESKVRGYQEAYKGTDNLNSFITELEKIKQNSQKKLMENIFGPGVFEKLSQEQKQFLGFEKS